MASISARTRTDGSTYYQVQVRKKGHPTLTKNFDKKKEAEVWATEQEDKINKGHIINSSNYTIEECINEYIKRNNVRKKDIYIYNILITEIGEFYTQNFTSKLLDNFLNKLRSTLIPEPNKKEKTHKLYNGDVRRYYSEGTIRKYYYAIKKALEWHASFKSYSAIDIFKSVKAPSSGKEIERRLEGDEKERILQACDKMYKHQEAWKNAIRFSILTTIRAGQLLAITWDMVDLDNKVINCPASITKQKKRHQISLTEVTKAILISQQCYKNELDNRVFWQWKDSAILGARFRVILKNADVKNFTWHCLRHEGISILFEKTDLNVVEIMNISGHAETRTLQRYLHLRPSYLSNKLEGLNV